MTSAPNTSLHWTPAAAPPSPVSSKPFGVETGVHEIFHECACELAPRSVYMRAGRAFALSAGCRDGVLYHLTGPSR
jgi:hypothetical protein